MHFFAAAFELFSVIDGGKAVSDDEDRKIEQQEWAAAVPVMRGLGRSWAQFAVLQNAGEDDFGAMDSTHSGEG